MSAVWPPPVKTTKVLCARCRLPRPGEEIVVADGDGERTEYLCEACLEELEHVGWVRSEAL